MSTTTGATSPSPNPEQTALGFETPGFETPGFDFLTWVEINRTKILTGLSVVVLAVVIFLFVRYQHEQNEVAASEALTSALNPGATGTQPTGAALLAVAEAHSGTRAAERARLLAAGRLYIEGKFTEAQSQFEKFTSDFPDSSLVATALLGIATTLDSQNKTNECLAAYQRVIASYPNDPLAWRARLHKARLHESLGQFSTAISLYDEISRSQSAGEFVQEAAILRSRLSAVHPELEVPSTVTNSVKVGAVPSGKP